MHSVDISRSSLANPGPRPAFRRRLRAVVLVFLVAVLAQCESSTGPPDGSPGTVTYRLVSPNGSEGALLAAFASEDVLGVEDGDAFRRVVTSSFDGTTYVALIHRFGAEGLSFEVDVANAGAPPAPTLVEVAGPDDAVRSLGGYSLEIVP